MALPEGAPAEAPEAGRPSGRRCSPVDRVKACAGQATAQASKAALSAGAAGFKGRRDGVIGLKLILSIAANTARKGKPDA